MSNLLKNQDGNEIKIIAPDQNKDNQLVPILEQKGNFNRSLGSIGEISSAGQLFDFLQDYHGGIGDFEYNRNAIVAYLHNSIAFHAARLIVSQVICSNIEIWDENKDQIIDNKNHPYWRTIRRPNPAQSFRTLLRDHFHHHLMAGDSYFYRTDPSAVSRGNGEIYVLRPNNVQVIRTSSSHFPNSYIYTPLYGNILNVPVDPLTGRSNIMHWKAFHPFDDDSGLSCLTPAWNVIQVHNKSFEHNHALLSNGGSLSLAFFMKDGNLTDEQLAEYRRGIRQAYGGSPNAGKIGMFGGDWHVEEFGKSNRDMEYIESVRTSAEHIFHGFGIPPALLRSDATFNNREAAIEELMEFRVQPLLSEFQDNWNHWMEESFPGLTLKFNLDMHPALEPKRARQWERLAKADFLTINEKRKEVGYSPIEGHDTLPGMTSNDQTSITTDEEVLDEIIDETEEASREGNPLNGSNPLSRIGEFIEKVYTVEESDGLIPEEEDGDYNDDEEKSLIKTTTDQNHFHTFKEGDPYTSENIADGDDPTDTHRHMPMYDKKGDLIGFTTTGIGTEFEHDHEEDTVIEE